MCAVIYKSPQPLFCLPLLAEKWWSMQVVKRQKMTCRTMKWARCGGTYCSKCKTTKMTLWCLHFSFITFVSYVCLPLRGKRSSMSISQTQSSLASWLSFSLWRSAKEKTASTLDASVSSRCNLKSPIDLTKLLQRSDTAYHQSPRLNWTAQSETLSAVIHGFLRDTWRLTDVG